MSIASTPGQRFSQLIQQLGLTKNAFAQSLGKTATVIQHIVDERNKPGYDLMVRICEMYPNVSSDWLLLNIGPMLREQNPPPLFDAPPAAPATAVPNGIDPADIPAAPRRRNGSLLQPAEIAATLVLAGNGRPAPAAVVPAAAEASVAAPPVAESPVSAPAAAPSLPPIAAPLAPAAPDPAYLAAALHTVQLQHQLALAEQRNQHLLEQQALWQQIVELLQGR